MTAVGVAPALVAALAVAAAVLVAQPVAPGARRLRHVVRGRPGEISAGPPAGPRDRAPDRSLAAVSRSTAAATTAMVFDLVAASLAAGTAPPRAVLVVGQCLERAGDSAGPPLVALAARLRVGSGPPTRHGLGSGEGGARRPPSPAGRGEAVAESLVAVLGLATTTGAGPVALIRAAADEERRRSQDEAVRAARRLGVLVLLPTGLCLLPAFVLLTVVPLVIDMVLG